MKIVIAPNAFKDCMTAAAAAEAMAAGVLAACPEAERVLSPVADGGDGLVAALTGALAGRLRTALVAGPRGEKVAAQFCHLPEESTAVIEMAAASGLALLPSRRRDPLQASTRGTGELILAALGLGARRIVVGIGGSATNDGGCGVAAALGAKFLDERGREVEPMGATLARIAAIDLSGMDMRLDGATVEVMCDVDNPLLGERGASRVYAPQKGASPEQVEELERGMENLAAVIERDLGRRVADLPGAGAAGGMGAGLHAFLGAKLRKGIDVVLELVGLEKKLAGADLVLTAEGKLDLQTASGKAPAGVAALAKKHGIPCLAFAGGIGDGLAELHAAGIGAAFSLCNRPLTLDEAVVSGPALLSAAVEQAVRAFICGGRRLS